MNYLFGFRYFHLFNWILIVWIFKYHLVGWSPFSDCYRQTVRSKSSYSKELIPFFLAINPSLEGRGPSNLLAENYNVNNKRCWNYKLICFTKLYGIRLKTATLYCKWLILEKGEVPRPIIVPNNDYIEVDVIKYRLIFALEECFAKPLIAQTN